MISNLANKIHFIVAVIACAIYIDSIACTSMIVAGTHSATGRPMLWKHRDTGAKGNFLQRVAATDSTIGYVALFNDGDSLLTEAWMGMNSTGFAIMNTATYNLHPYYKNEDGEGIVMSQALKQCSTVDDFENLLKDEYANGPSEIGINANFGVIDGQGGAAYFEADDYGYMRFNVGEKGYLIYTNFSFTGDKAKAKGEIRYQNACDLLAPLAEKKTITPLSFTEVASCSYWQSDCRKDFANGDSQYIPLDNDFIPRSISTASIVIEGIEPEQDPSGIRMWAALGYPPTAVAHWVTLYDIPDDFLPNAERYQSDACIEANKLRESATYIDEKHQKWLDLDILLPIIDEKRQERGIEYNKIPTHTPTINF